MASAPERTSLVSAWPLRLRAPRAGRRCVLLRPVCAVTWLALLVFLLALVNPDPPVPQLPVGWLSAARVRWVEDRGRLVNTALQIGLPILLRDGEGIRQLVVIAVVGVAATQGLKRVLDTVEVGGVRLGQRPHGPSSHHNMPSGHCSLASSGAAFICRRYSMRWALLVVPVLVSVMYSRVALQAHTIAAVIAGAALGVAFTWRFTCARSDA